jgi:hypothetical protein
VVWSEEALPDGTLSNGFPNALPNDALFDVELIDEEVFDGLLQQISQPLNRKLKHSAIAILS